MGTYRIQPTAGYEKRSRAHEEVAMVQDTGVFAAQQFEAFFARLNTEKATSLANVLQELGLPFEVTKDAETFAVTYAPSSPEMTLKGFSEAMASIARRWFGEGEWLESEKFDCGRRLTGIVDATYQQQGLDGPDCGRTGGC